MSTLTFSYHPLPSLAGKSVHLSQHRYEKINMLLCEIVLSYNFHSPLRTIFSFRSNLLSKHLNGKNKSKYYKRNQVSPSY